ncbi:MAG: coniferyl aldehyde dehydrogenase, partial [Alphaproteobacteria bacterium]|nr:coniferyl aldehyde dehydrogenase [Alphaproteobacteria bacterium]
MSTAEVLPMGAEQDRMRQVLERQRAAVVAVGAPSAELRIDRISRAIDLLVRRQDDIAEALREDFGHRSVQATLLTDIAAAVGPLKQARAHLRSWMRPQRRRVTPGLLALFG